MEHLRRLQQIYRYRFEKTFAYRLMLAISVILFALVLLVSSWWFVFAGAAGIQRAAIVRAVCATGFTILAIAAMLSDVRRRRPIHRNPLFWAAGALLLASQLLPLWIR